MTEDNNYKIGVWYAIAAYGAWGILPLYWKALQAVPAQEILAHRIFWSFIFVTALILSKGRKAELFKVMSEKKNWSAIIPCAVFITFNWGMYIWAVNANHVVEASMGYYINPLLSVLLGMVFLRERLSGLQYLSLVLASIGVLVVAIEHGKIPWIALSLAITFALYGLFKKLANLDSMMGLAMETIVIAPLALAYLSFRETHGVGAITHSSWLIIMLLMLSGIVTATPLLWFAQAANRLPLSTMGFVQYLSPTMSLLLGVFLYKEPFTLVNALSFAFIWVALIVYSISKTSFAKNIPALIRKS